MFYALSSKSQDNEIATYLRGMQVFTYLRCHRNELAMHWQMIVFHFGQYVTIQENLLYNFSNYSIEFSPWEDTQATFTKHLII